MKKLIKATAVICIGLLMSTTLSSCYGKFSLTRKLYTWNGTLGNKFVKSGVMWVLMIVPVYQAAGFVDAVFLNLVEFWTGSNPLALKEGEKEIQMVEKNGVQYEMTATRNRMDIRSVEDNKTVSMIYNETDGKWVVGEGKDQVVVAYQSAADDQNITLFNKDNKALKLSAN